MKLKSMFFVVGVLLLAVFPAAADIVLSIDPMTTTVGVGDTFSVDIWIEGAVDLYAFDLDIAYDPAILDFDSFSSGGFLASEGDAVFAIPPLVNESLGQIDSYVETLFGALDGVDGSGPLLTLNFVAKAAGVSPIEILGTSLLLDSLSPLALTYIADSGMVTVETVSAPEPASLLMLTALAGGIVGLKRRRK